MRQDNCNQSTKSKHIQKQTYRDSSCALPGAVWCERAAAWSRSKHLMPLDPKQLASQFRSSRRLRTNSSPTDAPGIGGAQDTQNSCMRALRIVPLGNLRGIAAGGVGLPGVCPFHQEVLHHLGIRCLRSAVQRIGRVHQVPLRTGHSTGEAVHLQKGCDGCLALAILPCAAGCILSECTLRGLLNSLLPAVVLCLLLLLLLAPQLHLMLLAGALLLLLLGPALLLALLIHKLLLSLELTTPGLRSSHFLPLLGLLVLLLPPFRGRGSRGCCPNRRRVKLHGVRGDVAGAAGGSAGEEIHGCKQ
mmetsp:Transcript_28415/g.91475  ORF Transcript_28415/g.91475 Transcript_28415/m.91475 type:complete len:303 (-) Transcript_28415:48-956(-)